MLLQSRCEPVCALAVIVHGNSERVMEELKSHSPESLKMEALSLEEIFVASLKGKGVVA